MSTETGLLTLYARKEPSQDSIAKGRYHDVVLYRKPTNDDRLTDKGRRECPILPDGTQLAPCARFSWASSAKPRQGQRTTMMNCYRWALIWLPEVSDKRPKHIRIYDNGGATADRYTVVYMDQVEQPGHTVTRKGDSLHKTEQVWVEATFNSLGMNSEPFHGIGQHGAAMPGPHLGKRIKWEDLPEPCQRAVIQDTTTC